ncbi:MAG: hypothetical protein ACOC0P_07825 [Planctomycetota bacterium]
MDSGKRLARLEKMLEADPNDAFCLYSIGFEHAREDRHEEAIGWYERAMAADGSYHYAWFQKAKSLIALHREDDARTTLRDGLERAEAAGDTKATSELRELLSVLGG